MTLRFGWADISHWQNEKGPIDFNVLAAASLDDCFACKMSQRNNYVDPYGTFNRTTMGRLVRRRGLYHWQSPTSEASLRSQVAHYLRTVGSLGLGEFFMLDAEQYGITEPETLYILEAVEEVNQRSGAVYTGISVAGGAIWRSQRIREGKFGPRAMLLAAYMTEERLAYKLQAAGIADLPIDSWQYSSDGPVPGVVGWDGMPQRCDMNMIRNYALFDRICGYTDTQEQPTGEDMDAYISNAETRSFQGQNYPPFVIKYFVRPEDGRPRRISGLELTLRGLPQTVWNSPSFGTPVSNADFDNELGGEWIAGVDDVQPSPAPSPSQLPAVYDVQLDVVSIPGKALGLATPR